jgi:hypothetical protein
MIDFLNPVGVFSARYGLSLYYNSVLFTCFISISEQTIVSHTALTDGFLKTCRSVLTARYVLSLTILQLYLRVIYGSRNKLRFFPHTALND